MNTGRCRVARAIFIPFCAILLLSGLMTACRTSDVRIQTIRVPQMINNDCAQIIIKSVEKLDGFIKVDYALADKTVSITYDSMKTALKNLEFAIAAAGFDANDTPADQRVRVALPPACLPAAPAH